MKLWYRKPLTPSLERAFSSIAPIAGLAVISLAVGAPTLMSIIGGAAFVLIGGLVLLYANSRPGTCLRFVRYPDLLSRICFCLGLAVTSNQPSLFALAVLVSGFMVGVLLIDGEVRREKSIGPGYWDFRQVVPAVFPLVIPARVQAQTLVRLADDRRPVAWRGFLILLAATILCQWVFVWFTLKSFLWNIGGSVVLLLGIIYCIRTRKGA